MNNAAKVEPPPFTSTRFPDSSSPSRFLSLTSFIGAPSYNASRQDACPNWEKAECTFINIEFEKRYRKRRSNKFVEIQGWLTEIVSCKNHVG